MKNKTKQNSYFHHLLKQVTLSSRNALLVGLIDFFSGEIRLEIISIMDSWLFGLFVPLLSTIFLLIANACYLVTA